MMWDGVRKYISRETTTSSSKKTRSQGTSTSSKTIMASLSSRRDVNGLSNSLTAYCSYGLATQNDTASRRCGRGEGDLQPRRPRPFPVVEFGIARRLGSGHNVTGEQVAPAQLVVIGLQVIAEAFAVGLEQLGMQREPDDEAGHVIGRAAKHSVAPFGDAAMGFAALAQVIPAPGFEEPRSVAFSVLLAAHDIEVFGRALAVVDCAERTRGVAERWMAGHVADELAPDIDATAVAQSFEIIRPGSQHQLASSI